MSFGTGLCVCVEKLSFHYPLPLRWERQEKSPKGTFVLWPAGAGQQKECAMTSGYQRSWRLYKRF